MCFESRIYFKTYTYKIKLLYGRIEEVFYKGQNKGFPKYS